MNAILEARKRQGLSQRVVAARAGISFKGLQLIEEPGHNWRIGSMARIAGALGMPEHGVELVVDQFLRMPENSLAAASIRIALHGPESWKIHLMDYVDAYRLNKNDALMQNPPVMALEERIRALCASVTEALCHENSHISPAWCAGIPPLREPWFVSGIENLKASALLESPVWYRRRNIFVLSNFLNRA